MVCVFNALAANWEKMLIIALKNKHPFIYYTALSRYNLIRGGSGKYSEIFHFVWASTIEGTEIWGHVSRENYTPFYEFHGRNPKTGLLDKK